MTLKTPKNMGPTFPCVQVIVFNEASDLVTLLGLISQISVPPVLQIVFNCLSSAVLTIMRKQVCEK